MKPKLIFLGALFVVLAAYGYFKAVSGVTDGREKPVISLTPTTFDFGQVRYGDVLKTAFTITNLGQSPLEISKVATSCSCTSARAEKTEIEPGETGKILVVYNTAAMGEFHGKGRQERIIYVKSNDPLNPQTEVMIYATVQ